MAKLTVVTAAWRLDGLKNVIKVLDNQTCPDFEHIVVRDCSKQISSEALRELCSKDPRRHWIDIGVHTGYYGCFARNIGVMASFTYFAERIRKKDEDFWIVFLDDDCEFYPDYIEKFFEARKEHPEVTLIGCGEIEIRGKRDPNYCKIIKNTIYPNHTDIGAWFYKKELFEKYGYFEGNLQQKITYDFKFLEKVLHTEGVAKIHKMPDVRGLVFYHKKR